MADTDERLLPDRLVKDIRRALARLRYARSILIDHPVMPPRQEYRKGEGWRPHPVDCDICASQRLVDLLLDEISQAMKGGKHRA